MTGWKTLVAGIGIILTGLGIIAKAVTSDQFDFAGIQAGVLTVLAGLAALGIGHKLDKGPQT